MRAPLLVPAPRSLAPRPGAFPLPGARISRAGGDGALRVDAALGPAALARLAAAGERTGVRVAPAEGDAARVRWSVEPGLDEGPEGYRLDVGPDGVRIAAADEAGAFRAACTLAQLVEDAEGGALAGVAIRDRPALRRRGALVDVSRDRVPTLAELRGLVDRLAALKLNELELYVEHAFAHPGHEEVWRDASPLTPDELRELDAYCRARHVELVPNQQSLGHLHRWLRLPRYRSLAEVPDGVVHPFSDEAEPFSLCPTDPRALELVRELWDGLLPCFTSGEASVGLDETFDLGTGRSRAACGERGVGAVWLAFLRAVHRLLAERGRRTRFWADVLLEHAALARDVPRDAIALVWGYEAGHDLEADARRIAEAGVALHVCPGTSSWQSFAGRPANAAANVARAGRAAAAVGARGLLVTDWGDRGHLQPAPASWPGWLAAAEAGWRGDAPPLDDEALAARLGARLLGGDRGAARAWIELGRAGEDACPAATNGTAPFFALLLPRLPVPGERTPGLEADRVAAALARADAAAEALAAARLPGPEGPLVAAEAALAARWVRLGLRVLAARLAAGPGRRLSEVPAGIRGELAAELRSVLEGHRALWPARSRPGGLGDSCRRLAPALALLEA